MLDQIGRFLHIVDCQTEASEIVEGLERREADSRAGASL